jgi:phage repressor protein C with HTH and peptisase S24 domain
MINADPRTRLLALAEERGISLSALSAMIGRNSTYLQQFIRKGSPRKLEERDRRRLADFLGVGEGELGAPEYNSHAAPKALAGKPGGNPEWLDIPRIAAEASAGPGAVVGEDQALGALRFSARWLRGQGLEPGMLSAIVVAGDSMEPLLRDGDEILVDRTPRPLRDGVHVVRVGETLLVKRVQTGVPGRIVLESQNPAYRPIEIDPREVEVIGRVVWKSGRL